MIAVEDLPRRSIHEYRQLVGEQAIDELHDAAKSLSGARVLHLNATAYGGGVAELLNSVVPLMRDVGLDCHWQVLAGSPEFFHATKALHNGLQGEQVCWSSAQAEVWRSTNRENALALASDWDYIVVHDAQPVAILAALEMESGQRPQGHWIWRCHIDLTTANQRTWNFLAPYVEMHDAAIFTLGGYVPADLRVPDVMIIPPAIDPLTDKNRPVEKVTVRGCLERYGLDPNRPLVLQVSRFDPWKDPLGVIDAYKLAKTEVRGLQLALVASMADDDPEGWDWYERIVAHAAADEDIHVLSNLDGVGAFEVNCFQRAADVVVQKSTREGFGLVVAEALWKGRAVVAGNAGGIPLQIHDGETGRLVETTEQCADAVVEYLKQPLARRAAGEAGRERVRENFLITRYLHDYLILFNHLARSQPVEVAERRPVLAV